MSIFLNRWLFSTNHKCAIACNICYILKIFNNQHAFLLKLKLKFNFDVSQFLKSKIRFKK
jgi:hypothetical protein